MNADKTEYMCFNQGDISTLNGGSLKIVDEFTFLDSNVSSTESDARGVMVIVAGCGHDDTSSDPGRTWLHFTQH